MSDFCGAKIDFDYFFKHLPHFHLIIDEHQNVEAITDAFLDRLERTREEVLRQPLAKICVQGELDLPKGFSNHFINHRNYGAKKFLRTKHGHVWCISRINRGPSVSEVYMITLEENKAAEKTRYIAHASHELRAPLGAIIGFAEILRNEHSEEKRAHYIDIIRGACRQLLGVVDQFLDMSLIESNKLEFEAIPVSPLSIAREVVAMFAQEAKLKKLRLVLTVHPSTPETVISDPTRVRQILTNLVGNAVKFTNAGRIELVIDSSEDSDGPILEFRVIDTGKGIPERDQKKLFRSFAQGHSSTRRIFGGSGLGLKLSRDIARAMGGNIFLSKSTENAGSEFVAWVRVLSTHVSTEIRPAHAFVDGLKGKKILLVDDAADNREFVFTILKKSGADVRCAANGVEGCAMASAEAFDLILMDLQMPKLDGFGALATLREQDFVNPILALTACALKEERDECLRAGFTEHISKPVSPAHLVGTISKVLSEFQVVH